MFFHVYREPRCVFIRVRKTGSTSIVRGLLAQADGLGEKAATPPAFADAFHFAFVRNPFARLYSAYEMFQIYAVATPEEASLRARLDLNAMMDVVEDERIAFDQPDYVSKLRLHALPMSHPGYNIARADFVGRFETYVEDYRRLAERLGLAREVVHLRERKIPFDYREKYDVATRRRAGRLFAADLERFGYDF